MKSIPGLLASLCVVSGLAGQQPPDIGPPPGRLVDIGGRTLHLLCSGRGSPTVVLEAGASAFAIDWTLVQRDVARTTRVCSYDRIGFGWSDPATPGSPATVSKDLHDLLQKAGEKPPYVLVGASLGGLHVRSYTADYPEQVAGMVLVDPAAETRLFAMFQGQAVTIASLSAEQMRSTIPPGWVRLPPRSPQTGAPFDRLPPDLYATRIKLDQRLIASFPDSVSYDMRVASIERDRARLARLLALSQTVQHPLGARPLVVLTRGIEWSQGLHEAHEGLTRLSTNSRHTRVEGAGHEIHLFAPAAVITAIADVVGAVRGDGKLRSP
jgi:pimeloyl-ACP methyl ester carboxylesterase